ncbi:MAG: heparinase II/III family protein [Lachnospiraceae bacterium]|nr:heparinase II/III family protein [Lachnospiraceae bacterium]
MAHLKWYLRRLCAMSLPEILWRIDQKRLTLSEERTFRNRRPVTAEIFNKGMAPSGKDTLSADPGRLYLNTDNQEYALRVSIPLPAPYRYEEYRMRWHAGFQTDREWPLIFSPKLDYRGMDDIGDARTNWELNKHFQFALLAKDYLASNGREWFLSELETLFDDWDEKNPFLYGISWTSAIEIAERTINWCLTFGFLSASSGVSEGFLHRLTNGIINMADYLFLHYSRYSSANNHLIIEISAVLHAGVLTDHTPWTEKAIQILDRELFLQDYADGVNKEEALYYQAFMMEAYALDLRLLRKNHLADDKTGRWMPLLQKMSRYIRSCIGDYGEIIEFGDNDDGKLLDLAGGEKHQNYYDYILQLMSVLLPERYVPVSEAPDFSWHENICWLFTGEELAAAAAKPLYTPAGSTDYAEGGNAILRSADGEVLIGIDHAPLGYGALCAHGHADALSFQAYYRGEPFICDPGTYIYHTDEAARNAFRSTAYHNTVCIGGRDQSEMLGAFLWGRKASCRLLSAVTGETEDVIDAEHDGYRPITHRRKFTFDRVNRVLTIEDHVGDAKDAVFSLLFSEDIAPREREGSKGLGWRFESMLTGRVLGSVEFMEGFAGKPQCEQREISRRYGYKTATTGLSARIAADPAVTVIRFGGQDEEQT